MYKLEHVIKNPVQMIADLDALYNQNVCIFRNGICQLLLNVSAIF